MPPAGSGSEAPDPGSQASASCTCSVAEVTVPPARVCLQRSVRGLGIDVSNGNEYEAPAGWEPFITNQGYIVDRRCLKYGPMPCPEVSPARAAAARDPRRRWPLQPPRCILGLLSFGFRCARSLPTMVRR